mmetsp:Transcript_3137/g.10481  ORF Transcript_3137/g.10481 Transcript_3137/m.10481 type:complete len:221 (-) Transcript_3137:510-1172(-)
MVCAHTFQQGQDILLLARVALLGRHRDALGAQRLEALLDAQALGHAPRARGEDEAASPGLRQRLRRDEADAADAARDEHGPAGHGTGHGRHLPAEEDGHRGADVELLEVALPAPVGHVPVVGDHPQRALLRGDPPDAVLGRRQLQLEAGLLQPRARGALRAGPVGQRVGVHPDHRQLRHLAPQGADEAQQWCRRRHVLSMPIDVAWANAAAGQQHDADGP